MHGPDVAETSSGEQVSGDVHALFWKVSLCAEQGLAAKESPLATCSAVLATMLIGFY